MYGLDIKPSEVGIIPVKKVVENSKLAYYPLKEFQ